jgi:hypothetical protein
MIARQNVHRRNRRNKQISQGVTAGFITTVNTVSANKWAIALSAPVSVVALPTDFTVNGAAPTAVTVTDPQHILLTYTVNVAAGQVYVIPAQSPNIRTQRGGFLAAATGTF